MPGPPGVTARLPKSLIPRSVGADGPAVAKNAGAAAGDLEENLRRMIMETAVDVRAGYLAQVDHRSAPDWLRQVDVVQVGPANVFQINAGTLIPRFASQGNLAQHESLSVPHENAVRGQFISQGAGRGILRLALRDDLPEVIRGPSARRDEGDVVQRHIFHRMSGYAGD